MGIDSLFSDSFLTNIQPFDYLDPAFFREFSKQAEKEIYEAIRFDWEKQRQLYMPSMRNQGIDSEGSRG